MIRIILAKTYKYKTQGAHEKNNLCMNIKMSVETCWTRHVQLSFMETVFVVLYGHFENDSAKKTQSIYKIILCQKRDAGEELEKFATCQAYVYIVHYYMY